MRFDDSLKTVLSGDIASGHGAQAAWRQLVDLISRGRASADAPQIARLRLLRQAVPVDVRAASGRALAFAHPPAALVGLFGEDELSVAAPVLRTATLDADDWIALLPGLGPTGRSVLRHRRDLPREVRTALGAFGSADFVIAHVAAEPAISATTPPDAAPEPLPSSVVPDSSMSTPSAAEPVASAMAAAPRTPVGSDAIRHAEAQPVRSAANGFVISDLVARIDAFNRAREEPGTGAAVAREADTFRYETDAEGVIRWVDGVSRTALVGASLARLAPQGVVQADGVAAGALRRRSRFSDARLEVGGVSDAAGSWRISGVPTFDPATGRFTGLRGVARRPRIDESAAPVAPVAASAAAADSLRQLVHELRTPTNAIAGFAELIETQLLGPVADPYREQAGTIRTQASALIAAIDDLDIAARLESRALELRSGVVAVAPLLERIARDLAPLAELRGATLSIDAAADCTILGDDRAVERLLSRLIAALVSAAGRGERIGIRYADDPAGGVAIVADRPAALGVSGGDALLALDREDEDREGGPLLGTGFALRLARNLAVELGGALLIGADRLTLRLPGASGLQAEADARPHP